jgi:cephalosporin-C deacetylase-like acetyl esterase
LQNPPGFRSPAEWNKHGRLVARKRPATSADQGFDSIQHEDTTLTTEDGASLHTWLLLQDDNESEHHPVLIYFHGNAGNMGFRLKNAVEMFVRTKMNIVMMDYRGYGNFLT